MGVFLLQSKQGENPIAVCDIRTGKAYDVKAVVGSAYGIVGHPEANVFGPFQKSHLVNLPPLKEPEVLKVVLRTLSTDAQRANTLGALLPRLDAARRRHLVKELLPHWTPPQRGAALRGGDVGAMVANIQP